MVRGSLRNPHAVVVAALTVVLLGGVAASRIPTDVLPTFTTPAVQVLTLYPGMPAEVMEKDITSRLERWTGQSNGISRQEARSMNGVSIVRDYFRPDIDPNTAMSQVSSLAIADMYYLPPGTIPPMIMPFDPTASMPLCLVSVSSPTFDETELYDIAYFELRNRLQGISGVIAPAVYGGRIRRILAYVDRDKLTARNLSPMDVVKTLKDFNTFIPTGNAKIGEYDYQINADGMVQHVEQMNQFPIRVDDGGATVYIRDVGRVEDTHQIQSNIVRVNGRRQVYIPIYRQPGANTIAVVDGIKETIGSILSRLPRGVNLDVVLDQSVYVRKAIAALEREALYGALLAAVMIWLFIGSLRSTAVIMLSVPLSVLAAITCLYATGDSLNAMTLGGLALAVGRLVDDSIVVLENTHRHVALGKTPLEAARIAADEVRVPILVATVVTIVVFAPVVSLTGIGKFLFTPLALSVAFAMAASYIVALTIVPAYCARFLRSSSDGQARQAGWASFSDRAMRRLSDFYGRGLGWMLRHRFVTLGAVALVVLLSIPIYPLIGTELFPRLDTGQFRIQMRAPSGTRIERTEQVVAAVEAAIREEIAPEDLQILISNTGVLYDWPAAYTRNAGPMDSSLMVQLHEDHGTPSFEYVRRLRRRLRERFPMIEFSFETGGIISSAINFGLPAPINIQVNGDRLEGAQEMAREIKALVEAVPGAADVRIQQKLDYPQLSLEIDRAKAALLGINADEAVKNIVASLNSSVNFDPAFWIDERNGNHYFVGVQYREQDIDSIDALLDIPITGVDQDRTASAMDRLFRPAPAVMQSNGQPVLLRNIAEIQRTSAPTEVTHLNISRVTDIFADVDGRDIGAVARDIDDKLAGREWPEGYRVDVRGEVASMRESFGGLAFGFGMAVILVYFVMVALFRSFLDPFIVMLAIPLGLLGVVWILWLTDTTLNIQSFMGAIFMIGIAASTSTLLVEFANRLRAEGRSASEAALEAARIRMRPILMTTGTALLALLPPALNPAEPIMPLARAVIGGLASSTVFTLVATPLLYREFKR
ncbi:MAG: efflux RND transporter permease subunit [Bryobacterales bacterium]|nr:efflux RND transporter permease subunit [Bryobacterales bacterium]